MTIRKIGEYVRPDGRVVLRRWRIEERGATVNGLRVLYKLVPSDSLERMKADAQDLRCWHHQDRPAHHMLIGPKAPDAGGYYRMVLMCDECAMNHYGEEARP
jgi:hypothetical protein